MADSKLSDLTAASALTGTELFYSDDGAADVKVTATQIKTFAVGAGSVSVASSKTLTASNSLTLAGTDSTTMTFPSASGTVATLNAANLFTKANTFQPDSDAQAGTFRRNSSGQTANVVEIQTEANAFLAAFDKTGALTIGAASGNTGALKLAGTTSGTVTLSTADAAGTWTMKLPTSGGTNGYVLSTDGSGNTSWVAQSGGSSTLTVGSTATSGGAAGQLMFDTGSVLSESSSLVWDNTNKLLTATGLGTGGGANTGGLTVSGGALTLSGNISANAWTTSGIRYKSVAATLTDLTSTGTVAAAYTNLYGGNTIAASNATTFTDYFTTFITQPTAGTNVTFTNRWALGLSGNLNVAGTAKVATGTITTSQPVLDLSQTWNASGTTFTGLKLNVTNTASAAASLILDLQVGGTSQFSVRKDGLITTTNNISGPFSGILLGASFGPRMYNSALNGYVGCTALKFAVTSTGAFQFAPTSNAEDAPDTILTRAAAATLQLGAADAASPVAQTLQVQGSRSGTDSNVGGGNLTVQSGKGTGTGTLSAVYLKSPQYAGAGSGAQSLATGLTILNGSAVLSSYAFASIPAANTSGSGALIVVTDSGQTSGQITSGGSTNKVLAISNGTNWYVVFLVP